MGDDNNMDDLIEKTEAMIKRHAEGYFDWLPIKQIMPQLVAEIKRLRDPANILYRLDEKLKTISSDPLIVLARQRIDELEKRLAAKDAEIHHLTEESASYEAEAECLRGQLTELQFAMKAQSMAFVEGNKKTATELARWQKIAIESMSLKNLYLDMLGDPDIDYELSQDENYIANYTKSHIDTATKEAAKELDLQVTQEAGCVDRLEKEFLDHLAARIYYESIPNVSDYWSWHDYPEEPCQMRPKQWFRDQAQAALSKIREGK
jgi:uncharacterized coiled-coil protein SlyX